MIDAVPGRTEESSDHLCNPLSDEQRKAIEAMSIDLWQAFENSVLKCTTQADVVYEKFHIAVRE